MALLIQTMSKKESIFLKDLSKTLSKTLEQTLFLLSKTSMPPSYEEIHAIKSLLYIAIEQITSKIERLSSVQRGLRELLAITTSLSDLNPNDLEVGRQIVSELLVRYDVEIIDRK